MTDKEILNDVLFDMYLKLDPRQVCLDGSFQKVVDELRSRGWSDDRIDSASGEIVKETLADFIR